MLMHDGCAKLQIFYNQILSSTGSGTCPLDDLTCNRNHSGDSHIKCKSSRGTDGITIKTIRAVAIEESVLISQTYSRSMQFRGGLV